MGSPRSHEFCGFVQASCSGGLWSDVEFRLYQSYLQLCSLNLRDSNICRVLELECARLQERQILHQYVQNRTNTCRTFAFNVNRAKLFWQSGPICMNIYIYIYIIICTYLYIIYIYIHVTLNYVYIYIYVAKLPKRDVPKKVAWIRKESQ